MTTAHSVSGSAVRANTRGYPAGGLRFDWLYTALCVWLVGGLFLDGWAHMHGKVDESFFTPWHAVLYSGATAVMVMLFVNQWRNINAGYSLRRALPRGYWLSLMGVGVFLVSGGVDFIWHSLFGLEVSVEMLISPAHLLLALAGFMIVTGPIRAFWNRGETRASGWAALGPVVINTTLIVSTLMFFTQFLHPLVNPYAAQRASGYQAFLRDSLGIAGVLVAATLLFGTVLVLMRHWRLPVGALALLIIANALMMAVFTDTYTLALFSVPAALTAELLRWLLRPSAESPIAFYTFAFLSAFSYFGCYFVVLQLTQGIVWRIHLWMGAMTIAGIIGVMLAFLLVWPLKSEN